MKWLTIPADVEIRDFFTDEKIRDFSFKEFVLKSLLCDPAFFGKNAEDIASSVELVRLFRGCKGPGDVLPLEREDWKRLCDAAERPSNPFFPQFAAFMGTFFAALKHASDTKPEAKTELQAV